MNKRVVALELLILTAAILLVLGINAWRIQSAIAQNNHGWCQVLSYVTLQQPPKPANPNAHTPQAETFQFYLQVRELEQQFGCRKG